MPQGLPAYCGWLENGQPPEETVCAYNKRLIYYLYSLTGRIDLSEDLASEVFVRLLLKKPAFQSEEQLCSWLFLTAHNLAVDALRKNRFSHEALEDAAQIESEEAVLDELLLDERKKQLHAALKQLTAESKSVLTLLYFEERSYREIAKILRKSEKQVKNLAYRARKQLKLELERMGFIYED